MAVTPAQLRAYALARSLPPKTDLLGAVARLGYVQADPIRSPARAQDLILMQRVRGYRAGDLERRYPVLGLEEELLHNYGFVPAEVRRLLHPRAGRDLRIERDAPGLAGRVLDFARERGAVHPRDVGAHFGKTSVGNAWGGTSSAGTRALDALHYGGHLRVARREAGIKVFEVAPPRADFPPEGERARALVDLLLRQYAPLPQASLGYLVSLLASGVPQLRAELRAALKQLEAGRANVDGLTYLWPPDERPHGDVQGKVRLLAPFDPVVWDRRRFAHLHGWAYKFEAYTPAEKRVFGYYALPLLWGERAVGWANLKVVGGTLTAQLGFAGGRPKGKAFERGLESELARHAAFLGVQLAPAEME